MLGYTYGPFPFTAPRDTDSPLAEGIGGLSLGVGGLWLPGMPAGGMGARGALPPDGQQGAAGTARPARKAELKLRVLPARSAPLCTGALWRKIQGLGLGLLRRDEN